MRAISGLVEDLLSSQAGLCSVEYAYDDDDDDDVYNF
jgi:hypothetical protein